MSTQSIQMLDDAMINKIAAGEVIERPASVVKELVENAMDAGAKHITVEVVQAGRKLISVADDGAGMSPADAELAVQRHATSKVRVPDDLAHIKSMGFRGEALAAISSVCRFQLVTRRAEDVAGTEITMTDGALLEVSETGCPVGTKITVRQLFSNVPARRKFLKTDTTELGHIRQMLMMYALACPDIGFRLTVDEREVYSLSANDSLADRITELFGADMLSHTRRVEYSSGGISVCGYAGLPQTAQTTRAQQFNFINGRPAAAPVLWAAIQETYRDLHGDTRHPTLFLFLTLPPEDLDVNVHPAKREVRFRRSGSVRNAVVDALKQAYAAPQPSAAPAEKPPADVGKPAAVTIADIPAAKPFQYPKSFQTQAEVPLDTEQEPDKAMASAAPGQQASSPWKWCRVVGQVCGLYVLLETEDGLITMDPQAAHERVIYEKLLADYQAREMDTQGLLMPETVSMTPRESATLRLHLEHIQALGIGISEFGGDAFMVDAVPACMGHAPVEPMLRQLVDDLEHDGSKKKVSSAASEVIARAACRAASRARKEWNMAALEHLVVQLSQTTMPYTSPSGRPTMILSSRAELDRKFGR